MRQEILELLKRKLQALDDSDRVDEDMELTEITLAREPEDYEDEGLPDETSDIDTEGEEKPTDEEEEKEEKRKREKKKEDEEVRYLTQTEYRKYELSHLWDTFVSISDLKNIEPGTEIDAEMVDVFLTWLTPQDFWFKEKIADTEEKEREILRNYLLTGNLPEDITETRVHLAYNIDKVAEAFESAASVVDKDDLKNEKKAKSAMLLFRRISGAADDRSYKPIMRFLVAAAKEIFGGLSPDGDFDDYWQTFKTIWVDPVLPAGITGLREEIYDAALEAFEEGPGSAQRAALIEEDKIEDALGDAIEEFMEDWEDWSRQEGWTRTKISWVEEGDVVYKWVDILSQIFINTIAKLAKNTDPQSAASLLRGYWNKLKGYVDNLSDTDIDFRTMVKRAVAGALFSALKEVREFTEYEKHPQTIERLAETVDEILREAGVAEEHFIVLRKARLKKLLLRKLLELLSL